MGKARRLIGDKNYDRRVKTLFYGKANSNIKSARKRNYVGKYCTSAGRICAQLVREGYNKGINYSSTSSLFTSVLPAEEKWEKTAYHRPLNSERPVRISKVQNGNSGSDCQLYWEKSVGSFNRHQGCIFPHTNKLGVSQISSIQNQEQNICVPISSVRTVTGALGFHQSYDSYKKHITQGKFNHLQFFGRFHFVRDLAGVFVNRHQSSIRAAARLGVFDKLGEVKPNTSAICRIFGGHVGLERGHSFSSSSKGGINHHAVPGVDQVSICVETDFGTSARAAEFRINLYSVRKTPSTSIVHLDEPENVDVHQGQSDSFRTIFQEVTRYLDKKGISLPISTTTFRTTIMSSNDRRFTGRLVRCSAASQDSRALGARSSATLNKLEGVDGGAFNPTEFQETLEGEVCGASVRQYHHNSLSEKTRVCTFHPTAPSVNENSEILWGEQHHSAPKTPSRSAECSGRQRFSSQSNFHGMGVRPGNVHLDSGGKSVVSDRFVCDEGQQETSTICLTLPRQAGGDMGCFQHRLEPMEKHLLVSAIHVASTDSSNSPGLQRQGGVSSTVLAETSLVCAPSATVQTPSVSTPTRPFTESNDFEGFNSANESRLLETSRLATIRGACQTGLSQASLSLLDRAHRPSTLNQYQNVWAKFLEFLNNNHITHEKVDIAVVMNFLAFQAIHMNRQYRTVAGYKCALELPLKSRFNINFNDFQLKLLMRGIFNAVTPLKAAPMPNWSLNELFEYLIDDQFEPLSHKSMETVTQKLLCLILLASGRRIDEVGHFAFKSNIVMGGKAVRLEYVENYRPKHYDESFRPKAPIIERLTSNCDNELLLCPVRALEIFKAKRPMHSNKDNLWNLTSAKLSKIFIATIMQARARLGLLNNMSIGPHQVRKLAASYSFLLVGNSKSLESTLMERMGCASMSVLKKNYINSVPDLRFKCVVPIGTFIPNQ